RRRGGRRERRHLPLPVELPLLRSPVPLQPARAAVSIIAIRADTALRIVREEARPLLADLRPGAKTLDERAAVARALAVKRILACSPLALILDEGLGGLGLPALEVMALPLPLVARVFFNAVRALLPAIVDGTPVSASHARLQLERS